MDIEAIYNAYLKNEDSLRERDENVFHASSAGSCYRKQMYSYYSFPSDEKDGTSFRILRLGTIVHKDVEEALIKYQDKLAEMQNANKYEMPIWRSVYVEEKINELPWETNPVLKTLSNIKQQIINDFLEN